MERLPPNRRRHKVPPERRKRVSKACNSCNVRRIKCTGDNPCAGCRSARRPCVYPSASEERINISRATYQDMQEKERLLQACLDIAVPSLQDRMGLMRRVRETPGRGMIQAADRVSEPDDQMLNMDELAGGGRFLLDPDGQRRFVGNASGATFLDQLREFATAVLPLAYRGDDGSCPSQIQDSFSKLLGRYQTHDSRPLHLPVADPYFLPPIETADKYLSCFPFPSVGGEPGDMGIFYWGPLPDILIDVYSGTTCNDSYTNSLRLATLNAAFALATQKSPHWGSGQETGEMYFSRAKYLLGEPLDTSSRAQIPCLAMMGYYLLNANRRDAAYTYIRLAGHIAVTYGYYQSWMTSEMEKREFWTVYILDKFVSCLLGRPPFFSDDNISVELPRDTQHLPRAEGLRLHVKLARIVGYAVEAIYGYGGPGSKTPGLPQIYHSLDELENWRAESSSFLDFDHCLASETSHGTLSLHMAYNQAKILVTRQVLFSAVRQNVARSFIPGLAKYKPADLRLVDACKAAAYQNAQALHRLTELVSIRDSALGIADYHNAFNAAIVLELYRLSGHSDPHSTDTPQLYHLLDTLQSAGKHGNDFANDCSVVLTDFCRLTGKLMEKLTRHSQRRISRLSRRDAHALRDVDRAVSDASVPSPTGILLSDSVSGLELENIFQEFTNWLEAGPI